MADNGENNGNGGEVEPISLVQRIRRLTVDRDFASQLTAMITSQSLDDVHASLILDLLDPTKWRLEMNFLQAVNEVIKYEGFNPAEISAILMRKWTESRAAHELDPDSRVEVQGNMVVQGAASVFKYSSDESFKRDMLFICMMFVSRGAAYDKILSRSNVIMADIMRILRSKYNINTTKRAAGNPLDSKTITIPRIAASFPTTTVGLFDIGFGRTIYDISSLYPEVDIPRALLSPMASSVLPQNNDAPIAFMLSLAIKVDDILHQNQNSRTNLKNLYQYFMASYNSTAVTSRIKAKFCVMWGVGSRDEDGAFTYSNIVKSLKPRAKELISQMRPNDPNLNEILNKV